MYGELISIIIPVYNVDKYVSRCIDSILHQTYQNFEILLINDGSTDDSGIICDYYAKKDIRIRTIHQNNQGVSAARNVGLAYAKGDYIGFVDPDDWVSPHMYYHLYTEMIHHNANLAICKTYIVTDDYIYTPTKLRAEGPITITSKEAIIRLMRGRISSSPCDKLYRKSILSQNPFPKGRFHEDQYIMADILGKCERIMYLEVPYYYYYQRNNSTCHTFSAKLMKDRFEAIYNQRRTIKAYFPELEKLAYCQQIISNTAIYYNLVCKVSGDLEATKLKRIIREDMRKYPLSLIFFGVNKKRWLAAITLKYFPKLFKCYALGENIIRKCMENENINRFKYKRTLLIKHKWS